jgi:YesN/AraC family two-component response regulator
LIHLGNENAPKQSRRLNGILKYIEQNYSAPLSLSGISEKFSLSESYVARLFKNELNCKPSEYINCVRISEAEELLLTTDLSVSEIWASVGFTQAKRFYEQFHRCAGCPPGEYREMNK